MHQPAVLERRGQALRARIAVRPARATGSPRQGFDAVTSLHPRGRQHETLHGSPPRTRFGAEPARGLPLGAMLSCVRDAAFHPPHRGRSALRDRMSVDRSNP